MRILGVHITNFRGVREASVRLEPKTLLIGDNNVGKTTVLEALDLALGPERLRDLDAVTEHDFHSSAYLSQIGDSPNSPTVEGHQQPTSNNASPLRGSSRPQIEIRVLLGDLTSDERARFVGHLRPIQIQDREILGLGTPIGPDTQKILPVIFKASYDPLEDEFTARTVFAWPTPEDPEDFTEYMQLTRQHKRDIGFLYLRSLRTARRAATLQRGSLLDILLRLKEIRPIIWKSLLDDLSGVHVALDDQPDLKEVISGLRASLGHYLPSLEGKLTHSRLQVGRLTRKDLREQVTYFLETGLANHSLPFELFGTGTANLLVFALLREIAKAKQNVIFAMEEPEIALPPHTQRRVVKDIFLTAQQAIVTSHSPYVAERFFEDEILVLKRTGGIVERGALTEALALEKGIKPRSLQRNFRVQFAEGLLARATLVVEGVSEILALREVDLKLAQSGSEAYLPIDLTGVVLVDGQGSDLPKAVTFFRAMKIPTFSIWDSNLITRPDASQPDLGQNLPHCYPGLESLVAGEAHLSDINSYLASSSLLPDGEESRSESERRGAAAHHWGRTKGDGSVAAFLATVPLERQPPSLVIPLVKAWALVTGGSLKQNDPIATAFSSGLNELLTAPDCPQANDSANAAHS